MPFKIQRVPRGLNNLLSISGGETPTALEDRVQASLDLLQFYGLTQLQTATQTAPAQVEAAATASAILNATSWCVLYSVWGVVVKTATMTACRVTLELNRGALHSAALFAAELGPFGATETGNAVCGGLLPYPLLCPPGSFTQLRLNILGTDPNANCTIFAEFGVLGG